ncbi:MAG: hypothetical protein WA941_19310 [Nitrososphaeraceae archaeon]
MSLNCSQQLVPIYATYQQVCIEMMLLSIITQWGEQIRFLEKAELHGMIDELFKDMLKNERLDDDNRPPELVQSGVSGNSRNYRLAGNNRIR